MDPVRETPTRPVDYFALTAGYGALAAAVLLAARDRGVEPIRQEEVPALGLATFALSRLVAKEKVESWVREPFVEELANGERRPRGTGLRYAVGELLTCTRCVGAWSSLALVGLRLTRPREARAMTAMLAASALNDFLQSGFSLVCARGNAAQGAVPAPPAEAGDPRFQARG